MAQVKIPVGSPRCSFCSWYRLYTRLNAERVMDINNKAHVKRAQGYIAVRLVECVSDNGKKIHEKESGTYKRFHYCPVCGTKYDKWVTEEWRSPTKKQSKKS